MLQSYEAPFGKRTTNRLASSQHGMSLGLVWACGNGVIDIYFDLPEKLRKRLCLRVR
jgi:hypothetical protein